MAGAYENYATAQRLQVQLHNEWRHVRRLFAQYHDGQFVKFNDDNAEVKRVLTKATKAALYLADAKAQYRQAKRAAQLVAA